MIREIFTLFKSTLKQDLAGTIHTKIYLLGTTNSCFALGEEPLAQCHFPKGYLETDKNH